MTEVPQAIRIKASAPGKLVLSGEYAVLDGAPAICMAVDRRVHVSIESIDGDCHEVTAPGFSGKTGQFQAVGDSFEWLAHGDVFKLVEHVWRAARTHTSKSLSLSLDSNEFHDDASGVKFGIGSSAALAVALSAALQEVADTDAAIVQTALEAHRDFQGGLGSGVDVVCSSMGGLVEYTMNEINARRIGWPEGLLAGVVWVGVPANTGAKLLQLMEQDARPSRAALVMASRRMAAVWRGGATDVILAEYHDYISVLREFGRDHDLGIFAAGHAELAAAADDAGVVYKPCGAGGGDTGVVLTKDESALRAFMDRAGGLGVQCLDMKIDPRGAQVERGTA